MPEGGLIGKPVGQPTGRSVHELDELGAKREVMALRALVAELEQRLAQAEDEARWARRDRGVAEDLYRRAMARQLWARIRNRRPVLGDGAASTT